MRKVLFVFGQLTDQDVLALSRKGRRRRARSGSVLITEGVPVDTLYILLEGELDVVVGKPQRRLARLRAGEMVGEMSFIEVRPPSATVSAATDVVLYAIAKKDLQDLLDADPAFAARFYKAIATFLSDRLRQATAVGARAQSDAADELDDGVLDTVDRAGARFEELGRRLLDE